MSPMTKQPAPLVAPVSVAPMMEWTDRHCRYFLRRISRRCLLYTEMVTTGAVLHGDRGRLLAYHPDEHPLALQLGGSDPTDLAECARIAESLGFDEINLNVGCPSDRVQSGRFGACLMAEPGLVARCVEAMRGGGFRAGHGQVPHRDRRSGGMAHPAGLRRHGGRRRLQPLHRACPQGLADRAQPQGEPGRAAAALRSRLPAEGGAAGPRHRPQWRRDEPVRGRHPSASMSMG